RPVRLPEPAQPSARGVELRPVRERDRDRAALVPRLVPGDVRLAVPVEVADTRPVRLPEPAQPLALALEVARRIRRRRVGEGDQVLHPAVEQVAVVVAPDAGDLAMRDLAERVLPDLPRALRGEIRARIAVRLRDPDRVVRDPVRAVLAPVQVD